MVGARAPWSGMLFAGVLALTLWAPLPFGSSEPWALGLLRLGAFLLAGIWAAGAIVRGKFVASSSPLQVPLYALIAFGLLQLGPIGPAGSPGSVDPFSTKQVLLTLTALALFFSVALTSLDARDRLRRAVAACFWFGFALSVFAIIQSLSATTSIYWLRDASHLTAYPFGPFVNKNHFAGLVELWLPLGVAFLASGVVPRERRVLTGFACVVMLTAVALSRSRAGLAATLFAVGVAGGLALLSARRDAARTESGTLSGPRLVAGAVALFVLLTAATLAGVRWLGAEPVVAGFSQLPADVATSEAISRPGLWSDTWRMVLERPLLGSGLGAYGVAFTRFGRATGQVTVLQAHNDYLQLLAETGIVGLILGVAFVAIFFRDLWKALMRRDPVLRAIGIGAGSGCLGLMIHELVDFNLQVPSNALAFLFSAALVARASALASSAVATRRASNQA